MNLYDYIDKKILGHRNLVVKNPVRWRHSQKYSSPRTIKVSSFSLFVLIERSYYPRGAIFINTIHAVRVRTIWSNVIIEEGTLTDAQRIISSLIEEWRFCELCINGHSRHLFQMKVLITICWSIRMNDIAFERRGFKHFLEQKLFSFSLIWTTFFKAWK